jgi:hypothetical protein
MSELNKYYQETLKKIDTLVRDKQYIEAFEIVSQEIASPYIPMEFVERFEQLYVDLNKIVMVNQIKDKYNNMSKMEMLGKVYDGKKFDLNLLSYLLGKFHKEIDQIDLQYLNKIFLDKHVSNAEKIFALEQLKLSDIPYTFDFFNNVLNKQFKASTNSQFEYHTHPYFSIVKKKTENILMKDPSLATLCNELLVVIYEYYFGSQPSYEVNVLADKLTRYVRTYFEPAYKPEPEFKT